VNVVIINVQAQLGALEPGVEFATEHTEAQSLCFLQGLITGQAFCLQATFGSGVSNAGDLSHAASP